MTLETRQAHVRPLPYDPLTQVPFFQAFFVSLTGHQPGAGRSKAAPGRYGQRFPKGYLFGDVTIRQAEKNPPVHEQHLGGQEMTTMFT